MVTKVSAVTGTAPISGYETPFQRLKKPSRCTRSLKQRVAVSFKALLGTAFCVYSLTLIVSSGWPSKTPVVEAILDDKI
jgi:hypothetical protein